MNFLIQGAQFFLLISLIGIFFQHSYGYILSSAPTQYVYSSLATSSNGDTIAALSSVSKLIIISNDYGTTWDVQNSFSTSYSYFQLAMGSEGTFLGLATTSGIVYLSSNSGSTWSQNSPLQISSPPSLTGIAISSDGQYIFLEYSGKYLLTSSNYGASWAQITLSTYSSGVASGIIRGASCSYSCQTVGVLQSTENLIDGSVTSGFELSTNYGITFASASPYTTQISSLSFISGDGTVIFTNGYSSTYNNGLLTAFFVSSNGGQSFTQISNTNFRQSVSSVAINNAGSLIYALKPSISNSSQSTVQVSYNYGTSWSIVSGTPVNMLFSSISCDSTGNFVALAPSAGGLYLSMYNPTSQPTSKPSSHPSAHPSSFPTSSPSRRPTSQPTLRPSSFPTSLPSQSPTSFPTVNPNNFIIPTVTLTSTSQVNSYTFTGLGSDVTSAYLTINLNFAYFTSLTSDSYVLITATSPSQQQLVLTNAQCVPATLSCSSSNLITCAVNVEVAPYIQPSIHGGSLTLQSTITNITSISGTSLCSSGQNINDVYYQLSYTLTANRQPTYRPTVAPVDGSSSNSNIEDELQASGAPYYLITGVCVAYILLGMIIVRMRDNNNHTNTDKNKMMIVQRSIIMSCFDFFLSGYHIISEIFYIIFLMTTTLESFQVNLLVLGIILIIFRSLYIFLSIYFTILIFFVPENSDSLLNSLHPSSSSSSSPLPPSRMESKDFSKEDSIDHEILPELTTTPTTSKDILLPIKNFYLRNMNHQVFKDNTSTFAALLMVMFLDSTLVKYFPWRETEVTKTSNGYPDSHLYQMSMLIKFIHLTTSIIIQLIVFISVFNMENHVNTNKNQSELAYVIMYFLLSIFSLLFSGATMLLNYQNIRDAIVNMRRSTFIGWNNGEDKPDDERLTQMSIFHRQDSQQTQELQQKISELEHLLRSEILTRLDSIEHRMNRIEDPSSSSPDH